VASIIEASDYDESSKINFSKAMKNFYGFPMTMWDPFFQHIHIDSKLGHQKLLKNNMKYIRAIDKKKLNNLVNKIHDLKHAFDLQTAEIKRHYSNPGSYIPRQFICFFSI
jgi:hypothetical protein